MTLRYEKRDSPVTISSVSPSARAATSASAAAELERQHRDPEALVRALPAPKRGERGVGRRLSARRRNLQSRLAQAVDQMLHQLRSNHLSRLAARRLGEVRSEREHLPHGFIGRLHLAELPARRPSIACYHPSGRVDALSAKSSAPR